MRRVNRHRRVLLLLVGLAVVAALPACNDNSTPVVSSAPARRAPQTSMADARRLSDGANKLIDAMKKPTSSFRFTFSGQENLVDDRTQIPQVGPVVLQADITPDEISVSETRGTAKKISKAKKTDEMNWSMANLATLGVMTNPNFVIAVGSAVTSRPETDLVGATPADKFTFDTSAANPTQKMGLDAARAVLSIIKDCKGTAWIAMDSGLLIKFNIDADYLDKYQHEWKEHYEGVVTPK